jgi:hypothetical protein
MILWIYYQLLFKIISVQSVSINVDTNHVSVLS